MNTSFVRRDSFESTDSTYLLILISMIRQTSLNSKDTLKFTAEKNNNLDHIILIFVFGKSIT